MIDRQGPVCLCLWLNCITRGCSTSFVWWKETEKNTYSEINKEKHAGQSPQGGRWGARNPCAQPPCGATQGVFNSRCELQPFMWSVYQKNSAEPNTQGGDFPRRPSAGHEPMLQAPRRRANLQQTLLLCKHFRYRELLLLILKKMTGTLPKSNSPDVRQGLISALKGEHRRASLVNSIVNRCKDGEL